MIRSFVTPLGTVVIREANIADAPSFRELRLGALQNSPIAFSADYQKNFSHPAKYWEDLLSPNPDESTMFVIALHLLLHECYPNSFRLTFHTLLQSWEQ